MPLASAQLRDAIHSANPARATLTAIVAFHGLRSGQPRKLQLTDIHDGRLHMDQRTIPLAPERAATPPSWPTQASKTPNATHPNMLARPTASRSPEVRTCGERSSLHGMSEVACTTSTACCRSREVLGSGRRSETSWQRVPTLVGARSSGHLGRTRRKLRVPVKLSKRRRGVRGQWPRLPATHSRRALPTTRR